MNERLGREGKGGRGKKRKGKDDRWERNRRKSIVYNIQYNT